MIKFIGTAPPQSARQRKTWMRQQADIFCGQLPAAKVFKHSDWIRDQRRQLRASSAHERSDWSLCVHEAAHCVAAVLADPSTPMEIRNAQCLERKDSRGAVWFVDDWETTYPPHLVGITAMAGPLAESYLTGTAPDFRNFSEGNFDNQVLQDAITRSGDLRAEQRWRIQAEHLVRSEWKLIEDTARQLSADIYIRGDRITEYILSQKG